MFKRNNFSLISNPKCNKPVDNLITTDFNWYDKDGFELNNAERAYYNAMNYPINNNILNHTAWQETWFELIENNKLILDHSMVLCRCNYEGAALEQLTELSKTIPQAGFLIQTKNKWGYDFALDGVIDDVAFEVLHVEYDSKNYDTFESKILQFDYFVRHTDWEDIATVVWSHKDEWQSLSGFAQNDWKSNFILGQKKAEYIEKTI